MSNNIAFQKKIKKARLTCMKCPLSGRQVKKEFVEFHSPAAQHGGSFSCNERVVKLRWRHATKPLLVTAGVIKVKVFFMACLNLFSEVKFRR